MKYAFFKGCKIPYYLEQYGTSTRAVLKTFGVRLIELNFNCCGYPNRDLHFESFILSAARNMALAEKKNLDILTPCKCCYGSVKPLGELTVAAHYGCHALRPSNIVHFDDPLAPSIFEDLIAATGAKTVDWPRRLDCCGNPLWGKNNAISLSLMRTKVMDASESGADCICTACTYCQLQFDQIQGSQASAQNIPGTMPAILYSQLLGISMGLPERLLGIKRNIIPIEKLK
jgi:heterodisulfide reductase subunit B